jgi:carboxylesterase type B
MDDVVTVDTGRLRGISSSDGTVRSFLGVPYAAPPVGDLRWRPPQPVQRWSGIRDATAYGPASRQPAIPGNSLYYGHETRFSEDCLYLNVWTGSVSGTAGRPVMVWLHPGAYQFGSGQNPLYDGSALARDGITLVTINYRLGRFGFLSHPLLSEESGYGGSGNYGLMDIIEALRWIQRNIEQFGGSPDNVTLFCGPARWQRGCCTGPSRRAAPASGRYCTATGTRSARPPWRQASRRVRRSPICSGCGPWLSFADCRPRRSSRCCCPVRGETGSSS